MQRRLQNPSPPPGNPPAAPDDPEEPPPVSEPPAPIPIPAGDDPQPVKAYCGYGAAEIFDEFLINGLL